MKIETPSWDSLKWLVATLAIPLTMSYLGYTYQRSTAEQQTIDARLRLYTELLSKREQADTDLRKDMFTKVLEKFLTPAKEDIASSVVALELLTLNFHDSLNLSPLFHQLDVRIEKMGGPEQPVLHKELLRVAKVVKERQSDILQVVGNRMTQGVKFASLADQPAVLINQELSFTVKEGGGAATVYSRKFVVEVLDHDAQRQRVLLRVRYGDKDTENASFWVDPFDFPMVNFSRISAGERVAVTMTEYKATSAKIDFLYFPSSRSGVSDKPFIDEVVANLLEKKP